MQFTEDIAVFPDNYRSCLSQLQLVAKRNSGDHSEQTLAKRNSGDHSEQYNPGEIRFPYTMSTVVNLL